MTTDRNIYKLLLRDKFMEVPNINDLKKDLLQSNPTEIPQTAEDEMFGEIGQEKIEALKQSNQEINELIRSRKKLSLQVFEEGEKLKKEINNYILENDRIPLADQREIMREKNDLRNKKVAMAELQLNEKINCWKDIAELKRELRDNERKITEKEERMKMFNKLLEEDN